MRNEDLAHYTALEEIQLRIQECAMTIGHIKRRQKTCLYNDDFHGHDLLDAEIYLEQEKMKQLERSYEQLKNR